MKTTWRHLTAYTPMEKSRKAVRPERVVPDGPFVHAWHYPNGARTHVNVRIDADWCKRDEWEEAMKLLKPFGKNASWFVTAGAVADANLDVLEALKRSGVEIGSHMYYHFTFKDEPNNCYNMQRAHEWLVAHGVECRSFVSPSAKWNPGLQRCIERMGYVYSSEFGLAHDCLPFSMPSGGLQVPVHAVSPGNFRTDERLDSYYMAVVDALYRACLPIHLYAHPHDVRFMGGDVIRSIASLPDAHVSTLLDYALWWKNRRCDFRVRNDGDAWTIDWSGSDGVMLAVSWDGVRYSLLSEPAATFARDELPAGKLLTCEQYDFPMPTPMKRKLNWRSKVGLWLDLEYIVPPKEFRVSSLKTFFNYLLKLHRA